MALIPDDILKSFEAATKAKIEAISYDGQILEDRLKYSSWISALSIACLLMMAANFSEMIPKVNSDTISKIIIATAIASIMLCLTLGGAYHYQAIATMADKRLKMTSYLKQYSIGLSNTVDFGDHSTLYEQVWTLAFLPEEDRKKMMELDDKPGVREWLLALQAALLAGAMLLVFVNLFRIFGFFKL